MASAEFDKNNYNYGTHISSNPWEYTSVITELLDQKCQTFVMLLAGEPSTLNLMPETIDCAGCDSRHDPSPDMTQGWYQDNNMCDWI